MISLSERDELWEKHRPYVEILAQVNNSYVFAAELHDRYLFVSPSFNDVFGYDLLFDQYPVNKKGEMIDSIIHPDDIPILVNLQSRVFEYLFTLPLNERKCYKHIFEFRILGPAKKYLRVIFQYHILEGGESPDYILVLGIADIAPEQNPEEPVKFRLVNFKTNELVTFSLSEKPGVSLTKREVEILKLVNEGMLSKEISDRLSISIHTVNRHRQNILEKMNADNVLEAINYGRRLGLIN